MLSTKSVSQQVDEITIASIVLPLRSRAGVARGAVRVLVGEEGRDRYSILAGRVEFPTRLVSVPPNELRLAGGDVVLGFRDGYLEEVLVNQLSAAVDALVTNPPPETPRLARAAVACIRRVWRNIAVMPALGELLRNHEIRALSGVAALSDETFVIVEDRVQVSWMTV